MRGKGLVDEWEGLDLAHVALFCPFGLISGKAFGACSPKERRSLPNLSLF